MTAKALASTDEGWSQIRAGWSLITWSGLAIWDADRLAFAPVDDVAFEKSQKEIDRAFGRLIYWISFGVGAEYLCKGVCILSPSGLQYIASVVPRIPASNEDKSAWARLVNKPKKEAGGAYESVQTLPTFGQIAQRLLTLDSLGESGALVSASMRLLAGTIRNRDAHGYNANVRIFQFHLVENCFIPSFNQLLRTLDPTELGDHLREAAEDIKLVNGPGPETIALRPVSIRTRLMTELS